MSRHDDVLSLAIWLMSKECKASVIFCVPDGFTEVFLCHDDNSYQELSLDCMFVNDLFGCIKIAEFLLSQTLFGYQYKLFVKDNYYIIKDCNWNVYRIFTLSDNYSSLIAKYLMFRS